MDSLAGLEFGEVEALVRELGEPPYRAGQVFEWVQQRGADSYDPMTNVPRRLREKLAARAPVRCTRVAGESVSDDGTVKLLVGLADGESVECVLIPEDERRTACVSTQVGCGVGCVFCASGAEGVTRNLSPAEIVEQVLLARARTGARLTNLVVMGMGEPLHNVAALAKALRIVQDPKGIDLGSRRITVSTSGPRKGFEELLAAGIRVQLAISLHATTDDLRRRLVPRGGTGSIAELQDMAERWFEATGRDVTYEYVLLAGVNDREEDARALAALAGPHRNVNLIPMNAVPFAPELKAPSRAACERFAAVLEGRGAVVHLRRQRGDDVAAACGQLRLHKKAGRA